MEPDEKACPFCAETIEAAAVKCRWCGEALNGATAPTTESLPEPSPTGLHLCRICDSRFETARELVSHRINAHAESSHGGGRLVCPHCGVAGFVATKPVKMKKGMSGGKATAALLTGGLSVLATGLSRKATVTEASCRNCGLTWHIQ